MITDLWVTNWKPIANAHLALGRSNLLTGRSGTGKSAIIAALNVLGTVANGADPATTASCARPGTSGNRIVLGAEGSTETIGRSEPGPSWARWSFDIVIDATRGVLTGERFSASREPDENTSQVGTHGFTMEDGAEDGECGLVKIAKASSPGRRYQLYGNNSELEVHRQEGTVGARKHAAP